MLKRKRPPVSRKIRDGVSRVHSMPMPRIPTAGRARPMSAAAYPARVMRARPVVKPKYMAATQATTMNATRARPQPSMGVVAAVLRGGSEATPPGTASSLITGVSRPPAAPSIVARRPARWPWSKHQR